MKRKYQLSICLEVDEENIDKGKETAKKVIESLGLRVLDVRHIRDMRTLNQNNALHLWFEQIASESREKGLTMDMIVTKPQELPITATFLKDLFRLWGKKIYGKDSTAKLDKDEMSDLISAFERVIAERLDITIPFPSIDNLLD